MAGWRGMRVPGRGVGALNNGDLQTASLRCASLVDRIASPARRLAGGAVDYVVGLAVWVPLFAVSRDSRPLRLVLAVAFALAQAIYRIACIGTFGRTLGKWAAGTVVVDRRSAGIPTFEQAVRRCLLGEVIILAAILQPLVAVLVVPLFAGILQRPNRQGLHDHLAGTLVVRVVCESGLKSSFLQVAVLDHGDLTKASWRNLQNPVAVAMPCSYFTVALRPAANRIGSGLLL
jgi:uncharacterized RDD family membrane protein YckC